MRFSTRTRIAKTNMPLIQRSFYLFNADSISAIFLCNWTQCIDGFSLYNKGMLEKVRMQRTQQFSAFVCYWKNPVKCSAGLKIIFEQWPVVLTSQTNFSLVMSLFWLVKILKILILKNFSIKPRISPHMHKIYALLKSIKVLSTKCIS